MSKLGRSGGPAVGGISGKDQRLRDQGRRGLEATGPAHGPKLARREGKNECNVLTNILTSTPPKII